MPSSPLDATHLNTLLEALAEYLASEGSTFELVVVGGSARIALGLVQRATRDVDVVALRTDHGLLPAAPLPESLGRARDRVARDFGVPRDWLNPGPTELLRFGLPDGFTDRLVRRDIRPSLTILYASRFDQIHFKLFAMVDQGPGRHEADLRTLAPTHGELLDAARWTRTHDPSAGFRQELVAVLRHLGVEDPDVGP